MNGCLLVGFCLLSFSLNFIFSLCMSPSPFRFIVSLFFSLLVFLSFQCYIIFLCVFMFFYFLPFSVSFLYLFLSLYFFLFSNLLFSFVDRFILLSLFHFLLLSFTLLFIHLTLLFFSAWLYFVSLTNRKLYSHFFLTIPFQVSLLYFMFFSFPSRKPWRVGQMFSSTADITEFIIIFS